MEYPEPPAWNYHAFGVLPPFLRFDLLFIRDQNTDLQHYNYDVMEIDAAAPANNQIVLASPPQEAIPPIYVPSVEEAAEQAKLMSPRTITLLRQFFVATTDNPR